MPRRKKHINLEEWYTNDQAVKRLSENSGRPIDRNYPRTLAKYGKIETLNIGTGSKLYSKKQIDAYYVAVRRGRKAKEETDKTDKQEAAKV
jgi:hypothetical protein